MREPHRARKHLHAARHDRRWGSTVLRGNRLRHSRSSSCTNTPATTELGSADAPFRPTLSRHHLQRARLSAIRRAGRRQRLLAGVARRTISARCSTIWASTRRTSSACRWAASPRCISASAIPPQALSLVVAGCGYGAEPGQRERFRAEAETIADFIQTSGMAGVRRQICARPDPRAVREQGPARLRRVQPHAGRALGAGRAQHAARRAARAAVAVRSDRARCRR